MFNANQIDQVRNELSNLILTEMYPNAIWDSEKRKAKSLDDIEWFLIYVSVGFKLDNQKIVTNFLLWLEKVFEGLNFSNEHITLLLDKTITILNNYFTNNDLTSFLEAIEYPVINENQDSIIENPYLDQAQKYLECLLSSNRNKAYDIVHNLLNNETPIQDIYIHVFQHAMREIGNLWQSNQIQVGREHYATIVTQYLMSTMYNHIFTGEDKTKKLMACSIGSELHEMGIRMIADLFELNGWDTSYLGPNLPKDYIIAHAKEFKPDVIALSVTMSHHVDILQDTVDAIKKCPELSTVKILIGGLPFINNSQLIKSINADGYASNAVEGIKVAETLLQ